MHQRETPTFNKRTYNAAFREFGFRVVKNLRTAIITDLPDRRIPACPEIKVIQHLLNARREFEPERLAPQTALIESVS